MADTCVKCGEYYDVPSNSFFWTYIDKDDGWDIEGLVCEDCYNNHSQGEG